MLTHIHHVSYVVEDLDSVVDYLRQHLGLEPAWIGGEERGVREATYPIGNGELQVKQPLRRESDLAMHLRDHGPGIHHAAWGVTGIDALAAALTASGQRLRDGSEPHRSTESSDPRLAARYRVLNIMPESGHGLGERIQLVEVDAEPKQAAAADVDRRR